MCDYYSVQILYNLVSWPATSRLADHLSAVSEPPAEGSGGSQHYSDFPISHDTGCNLCLSCPLSACADYLDLTTFRREFRWYRHLQTTATAVG